MPRNLSTSFFVFFCFGVKTEEQIPKRVSVVLNMTQFDESGKKVICKLTP